MVWGSSGANLLTPMAAASRPTMPLLVGKSSVVRRVKREADPHDCIGPSASRARQALLDMGGEALDELVQGDLRHAHLRVAGDAPGLLELCVVFEQPGLGVCQEPAPRADGLLECVDELQG